jgi:hypothetical protein
MARGGAQGPRRSPVVVTLKETFAKIVGRHACGGAADALGEGRGAKRRDRAEAGREAGGGIHGVTMPLAAVVAFGALCVTARYSLAAPMKPV